VKKCEKKSFEQVAEELQVKKMIQRAKEKGIIKPHTEAFETNPVQAEKHKGNVNYFIN